MTSQRGFFLKFTAFALVMSANAEWQEGRCTYHPYESDMQTLGDAYDNSPGWCGIRYTMLNVARITAVHGMSEGMCNQCLEIQPSTGGPATYVLAVDWKGDPGLDIAKSSFSAIFPGQNPLDPQVCRWRPTDPSNCGEVCVGSAEECTPGLRNLLPAYLLPKLPKAKIGLDVSKVVEKVEEKVGEIFNPRTPNTPSVPEPISEEPSPAVESQEASTGEIEGPITADSEIPTMVEEVVSSIAVESVAEPAQATFVVADSGTLDAPETFEVDQPLSDREQIMGAQQVTLSNAFGQSVPLTMLLLPLIV